MSNEIDWSKAPEGATHANGAGVFFRENKLGPLAAFDNGSWVITRSTIADFNPEYIFERPTNPQWSGEGLPPVGVACEALWNESGNQWLKVKVFGVNEHDQPIHRWEEGPRKYEYQASPLHGMTGKPYFRPIRTPEQIAEDEREAAIQEMLTGTPWPGSDISRRVCEHLYDAGFRKQEKS